MPLRPAPFVIALLCLGAAVPVAGAPAVFTMDQGYEWPAGAETRGTVRRDGLVLMARVDRESAACGISLPWMLAGPLVSRGLLRLAADPLGFSAESAVWDEKTALVLDTALESSRRGTALMPLPGALGAYAREGSDGKAVGMFAGVTPRAGVNADAFLQRSSPPVPAPSDDWYFDRSPFPGGEVTHACGRLSLRAGGLALTAAGGASSAEWAGPGAFGDMCLRGGNARADAAVLLAAATPGYRCPNGSALPEQSVESLHLHLGGNEDVDQMDAAWSVRTGRPDAVPGLQIPRQLCLRLGLARRVLLWDDLLLSWIVEGDKEVSFSAEGLRTESPRISSAAAMVAGDLEARTTFGWSGADGIRMAAELALRPSTRLSIRAETRLERLGASSPSASVAASVALSGRRERHCLSVGLGDCPLAGTLPNLAECFRLTLSSSYRVE